MGTWIIWLSTSSSGCPPQKSGSLSRSQYLQADRTHSQLRTEGCTHQRHWCLASSSRSQYLQADSTRPQLRVEGCTHQRHTCLASWAAYSTCKQTAATLSSGWKAVHTRGTRAWLSGPLTVPASGQPPLSAGHRWMVQGERLHTPAAQGAWSRWHCLQSPTEMLGPDRAQHTTLVLLSKAGPAALQPARRTCSSWFSSTKSQQRQGAAGS